MTTYVNSNMIKITVPELLENKKAIIVDTRTPLEYEEAHIPGAINIPLFSNEERAIIGTIYKQIGQKEAIIKGIEFYSKRLVSMMEEYFKYRNQELIIYCWRGGMRSKTVVNFLDSLGFFVKQLDGGHKAYRRYEQEQFKKIKINEKAIVLYGLTGAGKTDILKFINEPKIDLEDLAQHRSSLLGSIKLKPRTQKMFDALVLNEVKKIANEKYFFVEGEARKIGDVQIPDFLWNEMQNGIKVYVDAPLNERVSRIVKEYFEEIPDNEIKKILLVISRLRQKLSTKIVEELKEHILKKEYDKFTEKMLVLYYDPLYSYSLEKNKYDLVIKFDEIHKAIELAKKQNK